MSLIEVLIALAIAGFVLTSAISFLISISDIWAKREQVYSFYEHADGVTEFLETSIAQSEYIKDSETSTNLKGNSFSSNVIESNPNENLSIDWANPKFFDFNNEPLLKFFIRRETPLLANNYDVLPIENTAYLYLDEEGLSILHHSILQDKFESERDYKRTMLSPFVVSLEYIYWNQENEIWEIENEPIEQKNSEEKYEIPNYIKIKFIKEEKALERIISLPKKQKHLILY